MERHLPRFPVYVISKGRHDVCMTADFLIEDGVPFRLVIEPQEYDLYRQKYPDECIHVLPFSNLGQGSIPARNWCWEHAKAEGHERHWILDDNIKKVWRVYKKKRLPVRSGVGFKVIEDFVDRYTNVGIAGMSYTFFANLGNKIPPFFLNTHVYSCLLIKNDLPHRWRGRYNEDTDLCLQVLTDRWCTVNFNTFLIQKTATLSMKGGNMTELYQGDGRLKMSRSLERQWPYAVETTRKYGRPQHHVKYSWRHFDHQLERRTDIDWEALEAQGNNNYGMKVTAKKDVKAPNLRALIDE